MLPWRFGGLLLELPLAQHANGITFFSSLYGLYCPYDIIANDGR
ncbi:hypothetical protein BBRI4_16c18 [Bifidobacterium breve]|nr:hypothetical protein BBRI4_16c18 [Bifidobacterium breve]